MPDVRWSFAVLLSLVYPFAHAQRPCEIGALAACPSGYFCAAEWQSGRCPARGICQPLLPIPARLELSLPVPAGERVYCAKGSLRIGESTHSACDPATRFAIDLAGTAADRPHFVLAPARGTVHVLGGCATRDLNRQEAPDPCNHGFGNLVRIEHGPALYSQVAHLSSILVNSGDKVERGDVIGIEGNTGNAGSKHIHWSLHRGSIAARVPGPTIPFPRIRLRRQGQTVTVAAGELRCGDSESNPNPDPTTLLESENRVSKLPPARFGFLTWLDEMARAAASRDEAVRFRAVRRLRDRYNEEPTAPYWIGVAYLRSGDVETAEAELRRAILRAERGEGPPWLRPWCMILLGEIAVATRRYFDARLYFEDALSTPGDDSTGFRARARQGLSRIHGP
jgi:hypothetical protein